MKVKYRVKTNEDFQKIIRDNKKINSKSFVLYYKSNDFEHARIGISTSKKLGNAVLRVKTRRQMRMMTKEVIDLSKRIDYIIIVKKNYLENTYSQNKEELAKLFLKVKEN